MNYVLILGAKSDIGYALAKEYAARGYSLYLAARNSAELVKRIEVLQSTYGVEAQSLEFDALQPTMFPARYHSLVPKPCGVVSAVGYLGDQDLAQHDMAEAERIIQANFTGLALVLSMLAEDFAARHAGFVIGISSVAGERGRKSNFYYGSAKAGLTAFLSGLRNCHYASGVQVLTVQLGYVRTKMTAGMRLPALLTMSAEQAARAIFMAQQCRKDVVYIAPVWRWIMLVIRMLPEALCKRLKW